MSEEFTGRDLLKVAALKRAIDMGLSEGDMIKLFTKSAELIRNSKTAGVVSDLMTIPQGLASLIGIGAGYGGLGLAVPALGAGLGSFAVGRHIGNTLTGEIPTAEDIHAADQVAAYEQEREEVLNRILRETARKRELKKPSNRKLLI